MGGSLSGQPSVSVRDPSLYTPTTLWVRGWGLGHTGSLCFLFPPFPSRAQGIRGICPDCPGSRLTWALPRLLPPAAAVSILWAGPARELLRVGPESTQRVGKLLSPFTKLPLFCRIALGMGLSKSLFPWGCEENGMHSPNGVLMAF